MAIVEQSDYEAVCDRCGTPFEHPALCLQAADAIEAAVHGGWRQHGPDPDGLVCPGCHSGLVEHHAPEHI